MLLLLVNELFFFVFFLNILVIIVFVIVLKFKFFIFIVIFEFDIRLEFWVFMLLKFVLEIDFVKNGEEVGKLGVN